jgi:endothelin-converting enzyme
MQKIYQDVVERLFLTLFEEEARLKQKNPPVLVANAWPPWPWPPWEGDDGEDDDNKPVNQTKRAHELAKKVLKFESQIANVSLDL